MNHPTTGHDVVWFNELEMHTPEVQSKIDSLKRDGYFPLPVLMRNGVAWAGFAKVQEA